MTLFRMFNLGSLYVFTDAIQWFTEYEKNMTNDFLAEAYAIDGEYSCVFP